MKDIAPERLKKLLHYDSISGVFTWRKARRGVSSGKTAPRNCEDAMTDIMTDRDICRTLGWRQFGDYWLVSPDDPMEEHIPTPSFSTSLDACFNWLVPWLWRKGYWVVIRADNNHDAFVVNILNDQTISEHGGFDKSPSIAFIKAFTSMVREV